MRYIGLGRLAHPRRRGRAGRPARHLARALLRLAPSTPRSPGPQHEAPRGEAHPHRRPARWSGSRCARWTRTVTTSSVGQPGEILSRGPDRFAGYTDPALTAEAVDDEGWFRTGDIGVIDADGYLTITDRVKDIIIRGGENVSAAEVEQLLAHMEGVAEVAVVAAPDERLGEHGCAFFRMQPGREPPDLAGAAGAPRSGGLGPAEVARGDAVVDELPTDAVGQGAEVRAARAPAGRRVRADAAAAENSRARRLRGGTLQLAFQGVQARRYHMRSRIPKKQIDLVEGGAAVLGLLAGRAPLHRPARDARRRREAGAS